MLPACHFDNLLTKIQVYALNVPIRPIELELFEFKFGTVPIPTPLAFDAWCFLQYSFHPQPLAPAPLIISALIGYLDLVTTVTRISGISDGVPGWPHQGATAFSDLKSFQILSIKGYISALQLLNIF